jgi:hypothetical protein
LISKNIAGFLAASVDAVKDPVLNYMNLNTATAGTAMLLARLGFDSDTIGLILSQPIIEEMSREYFKRNNEGYTSIEDVIQDMLETYFDKGAMKGIISDEKAQKKVVSTTDFTKEGLAKELSNGNLYSEGQARVLLLFKSLSGISKNLNTLTFLTKFNSISNAVGPTIADTLVLRERYNKFIQLMESERAPFSNNAIHVIDNSPILKEFYDSTVGDKGASREIFKDHFPHYSPKFQQILDVVRNATKAPLDAKTINKLVNDYMLYKLTIGSNPVIDTSAENRDKYINNFVAEFIKNSQGLGDNDLINIISFEPRNKKCPVPTLTTRTGSYNADMQERVKAAWSTLLENEDTFNLGLDLFIYNLYRNGFSYTPKGFIHMASVDTKLALGDYIDTISNPTFNDNSVNIEEFLLQYRRNHSNDTKMVPVLDKPKKAKGTKITVSTNKKGKSTLTITYDKNKKGLSGIIANRKAISTMFAPVIKYNNKLYYAENYEIEGSDGTIIYQQTSELGNTNNFLEYNANESAVDMTSVIGKKSNEKVAEATYEEEDDNSENDDFEGNDDNEDDANHNKDNAELTKEDIAKLFLKPESPLAEYWKEVLTLERKEGFEAATDRTVELMEQLVKDKDVSKKVKKEVFEILKKFCSR